MFKYKLEKPIELIQRLVEYSTKARKDGVLALEADINSEENEFLKICLSIVIDGLEPDYMIESNKIILKYYIKEFSGTKKEKYKVKKQMKLVLHASRYIQEGAAPRSLERNLINFYPNNNIKSMFI